MREEEVNCTLYRSKPFTIARCTSLRTTLRAFAFSEVAQLAESVILHKHYRPTCACQSSHKATNSRIQRMREDERVVPMDPAAVAVQVSNVACLLFVKPAGTQSIHEQLLCLCICCAGVLVRTS